MSPAGIASRRAKCNLTDSPSIYILGTASASKRMNIEPNCPWVCPCPYVPELGIPVATWPYGCSPGCGGSRTAGRLLLLQVGGGPAAIAVCSKPRSTGNLRICRAYPRLVDDRPGREPWRRWPRLRARRTAIVRVWNPDPNMINAANVLPLAANCRSGSICVGKFAWLISC